MIWNWSKCDPPGGFKPDFNETNGPLEREREKDATTGLRKQLLWAMKLLHCAAFAALFAAVLPAFLFVYVAHVRSDTP